MVDDILIDPAPVGGHNYMDVGRDDVAGGLGIVSALNLVASVLVTGGVDLGVDDLSGGV